MSNEGKSAGTEAPAPLAWPPGHYYSPIPNPAEIRADDARVFCEPADAIPAIDLNDGGQCSFFAGLVPHHLPTFFSDAPAPGRRYHFDNDYFRHGEALIYSAILRAHPPRRLIEVGSGFSSALALDVRDTLAQPFDCMFIEPYPGERLDGLLGPTDRDRVNILESRIQDVPTDCFAALRAGDILFIDSTHVLKTDSDVAHHLFRILPALAPGVLIHFHDIFWPFEYPRDWVYGGRAWNELYGMRAFLSFNTAFEIVFFNSYFFSHHRALAERQMPLALRGPGSSLWLRRR